MPGAERGESRHVGDPILESNITRRVDFALFMVAAACWGPDPVSRVNWLGNGRCLRLHGVIGFPQTVPYQHQLSG